MSLCTEAESASGVVQTGKLACNSYPEFYELNFKTLKMLFMAM